MRNVECKMRNAACAVLVACLLALISCGDSKQAMMAAAELTAREQKVTTRETSAQQAEQRLAEQQQNFVQQTAQQQHTIDQAKAELESQRKSFDELKAKLTAELTEELTKATLLRESIATAARRGAAPSVTADRVIVIDPRTDEVLFEKNADKRGQVASTQKLMTSNIIVTSGNLDQIVTADQEDTTAAPVKIGLKVGDQYPRRQLLTALMVHSFNDIAQALARDNAGSLEAFAVKMNERAKQLGMTNSHFVNPHGLPEDAQYSTARDMAKIAQADDALPELRTIVATKQFVFHKMDGKTLTLDNTNRVLHQDPNCDGMKTGYTQAAGYCLICSGQKDGRRRICVVLNDTHTGVWKDAQALLEWALRG